MLNNLPQYLRSEGSKKCVMYSGWYMDILNSNLLSKDQRPTYSGIVWETQLGLTLAYIYEIRMILDKICNQNSLYVCENSW